MDMFYTPSEDRPSTLVYPQQPTSAATAAATIAASTSQHPRSPVAGKSADAEPKRRAPIACRRCRRMRSKCLHDKKPPCKSCLAAGVPEECEFPSRGDSDQDRQFRHPRQRADRKQRSESSRTKSESVCSPRLINSLTSVKPAKWDDPWSLLPEVDIIKEGVSAFTLRYFQLGFIPKERFPQQLEQNPESISVFLLLSILSISARFNKKIHARYGSGQRAVEWFTQAAERLAINELYEQPTLERCQAFFLMSIAQQGRGMSNSSYINMGVATRMAALMRLHREETYEKITPSSPPEEIIRAESARRTLWMLHSQDNLHSGPYKPVSLASGDITALLPCDEDDFNNAVVPKSRAALEGTPPAIQNPKLPTLRPRSLFATLIQTHHLWGIVARRAVANEKSPRPGNQNSDYAVMAKRLKDFEDNLFQDHKFGMKSLKGHRQDNEDLAYLGCTCSIRLSNIVLRKAYMDEMIRAIRGNPRDPTVRTYHIMAEELFENVRMLYEQVDAQYGDERPPGGMAGTQMAIFCVYGCGLLAAYLYKFPQLEPHRAAESVRLEGKKMYERTISILEEAKSIWPLASDWLAGLRKWCEDPNIKGFSFETGTMTDGQEPRPYALLHPQPSNSSWHTKMSTFYPDRSTTPYADDRRHAPSAPETEPTTLPPLQSVQSEYADPPSLPPISPFTSQHQGPPPPQDGSLHPTGQNDGFYALYHAGQHQIPHNQQQQQQQQQQRQAAPESYPNPFFGGYHGLSIPDDEFNFNLQQMLDPSWSAPNAPAVLYEYQMPDIPHYPS